MNMHRVPLYRARCGFTLMELLIGVGILIVLVALLLPALSRTRVAAQQTNCLNQLRQIYGGIVAYSQDHFGYVPRGGTGRNDDLGFGQWRGVWMKPDRNYAETDLDKSLPAYLGGQEATNHLVVCPLNRKPTNTVTTYTPHGYPYVVNYEAMSQNGLSRLPANLWRVDKAKLILMVDSGIDSAWKGPGFTSTAGWDRIGERHNGRFNTLWADGTVTAMSLSQLTRADLLPITLQ